MLRKAGDDHRPNRRPSRATWITIAFAVIILIPSMIGFVMKFVEFVHTFQGDAQGAFAITPMVNYLLASLGFLCLLLWSIANGTYRDMETPKQIMLERDMMLDANLSKRQGANLD